MKQIFDADVFMGKILKLVIKKDLAFSLVDSEEFEDVLEYLKKDITVHSRRTLMRRLDEMFEERKLDLKAKLHSFKSKYSLTCDVWTSKNQLSFFGFTIHYIDDDWKMQEKMLAFKFLEGEHDGKSLFEAFIEVLEDYGIANRLLGVTADNASNNSSIMVHLQE
jgi:hypothetical protein